MSGNLCMSNVPRVYHMLGSVLRAHRLSAVRVNDNRRCVVGHGGVRKICESVLQLLASTLMNKFRLQLWSSSSGEGFEVAEIKSETCLAESHHLSMTGNRQILSCGLTNEPQSSWDCQHSPARPASRVR